MNDKSYYELKVKPRKRNIESRSYAIPPQEKTPNTFRQNQLAELAIELLSELEPFESYADAWEWIELHNMDCWFEFDLVNPVEWFCFRQSFLTNACYGSLNPLQYFQDRMRSGVETWEVFIEAGDQFIQLKEQPAPEYSIMEESRDVNRYVEMERARLEEIKRKEIEKQHKKTDAKVKQKQDGSFELTKDHLQEFDQQEDLF